MNKTHGDVILGIVEVITGCMFSGKTEELVRRLRREIIARRKVQVFKPSTDNRYDPGRVVSHNHVSLDAIVIRADNPLRIMDLVEEDTQIVGIDEVQFFRPEICLVVQRLINRGVKVICAGLKQDFKGELFGSMDRLLIMADNITVLFAICNVCGEEAMMTQRLINGIEAPFNAPQVLVGGVESYQARCKAHYKVPGMS